MSGLLEGFGRARRPFAWACLAAGCVIFPLTAAGVIFGDEPVAALFGSLLLFLDGYDKVADVEQEVDSEAAVDEGDA